MAQHTQDPDAPKNRLNAHQTEAQQKSEDQPNDNQPKPDDQQNAEDQPEPETRHNPEDQPNEKTPKRARAPGGNGVYCNKRMVRGMVHFLGRRVELRTGSGSVLRGALTAVGPLMDIELQQVRCVSSPRKDVDTTRLRDTMVFGWKDMASVCLLNEDDESEQPAETTVEDKTGSEPQRGDTSQQHGQYESEADGSEHQGGDTTEEELSVKSSDASGLVVYCVKVVHDIEYNVSEAGISEQEIDYYHATDNWEQEDEQQDGKHETQSDKPEKQADDQQQSGHESDPDNLEKRGDEQQQSSPQQSEENRSVSESHSKQQTNVVTEQQQNDVVSNASKQAGAEESGGKQSDPECAEEPREEKFTILTDETSLDASGKAVIQAESVDGGEKESGDSVAKKVKDQGDVEEKESDGAAAKKVKNQGDVEEKESDDDVATKVKDQGDVEERESDDGVATKVKDQGDVEEKESDDAAAKKVKDQGDVEEKESDDGVATKVKDQGDVEEKESDDGVATKVKDQGDVEEKESDDGVAMKVKDQGDGGQKESADSATSVVEAEAERVVGVKEQQTAEPAQHTDLNASKKLEQQAGREKPHVTESEAQSISTQQASLHLLDTPETQANDVTKHKKPDVSESEPKTENISEESKLSDVSESKPKTESNVTEESKLSDVTQSKPKTESNVTEESKLSDVTQSKPKTESNVTEESKLSDVTQSKPKPESNVTEEKLANIDMSKPDAKRDVTEEWKETDFDVLSQSETGASNVTKETEQAGVDVSNKPDTKRDVTEDWKETDIDGRREPETQTSDVTKEMEQADAPVSNKPETQSALTDEKEDTNVGVPKEPNASHATEEEEPTNMEVSQQVEEQAEKMEERNRTEKQQADRAATPKQVQQPKVEGWWHGTPLQKKREMLTPLLGTKVRVTKVFGSVYEGKYCGLTSSNILQLSDVMLVPPGGQADSGEVLHSVGLGGDSIDDIQPVNMKELESYYDSEDEADDSSDCHLGSENSSGWDVKEMLDSIPTKSDEDFYDKYGLSRPAEFKSKEECEAAETLAIQIANEIQGSEGFAQRVHWEEMLEEGSESEQTKGNPDRRGDEEGPEWL